MTFVDMSKRVTIFGLKVKQAFSKVVGAYFAVWILKF